MVRPKDQFSQDSELRRDPSKNEMKLADHPTTEDTDDKWSHLRHAIYHSAMSAFGRKEHKNADWFKVHWEEMQPVHRLKDSPAYKQNPSHSTRDTLRAAELTITGRAWAPRPR